MQLVVTYILKETVTVIQSKDLRVPKKVFQLVVLTRTFIFLITMNRKFYCCNAVNTYLAF